MDPNNSVIKRLWCTPTLVCRLRFECRFSQFNVIPLHGDRVIMLSFYRHTEMTDTATKGRQSTLKAKQSLSKRHEKTT